MTEKLVLFRLDNVQCLEEGYLRLDYCSYREEVDSCTAGTLFKKCASSCNTALYRNVLFLVIELGKNSTESHKKESCHRNLIVKAELKKSVGRVLFKLEYRN